MQTSLRFFQGLLTRDLETGDVLVQAEGRPSTVSFREAETKSSYFNTHHMAYFSGYSETFITSLL